MIAEIITIFIVILVIEIMLSFVASSFTESIVMRVTDWCLKKMEAYETKSVSRFSVGGIVKTVCSVIITTFKFIDKIENPRLRTGLKLNAVSAIVFITLALLSFLLIALFYIAIVILYVVITILVIWVLYKLLELWYRHEKGLPLFPDKDDDYYEVKTSWWDRFAGKGRKTVYDPEGDKVGDISTSTLDKFAGKDRQTIRDADGKKVGDISKSTLDKFAGKDRLKVKDIDGKKIGDISKSTSDKFAGKDRQTIRDEEGDTVGDITISPGDDDSQIIRTKKHKE
ncbi:MAG: hypothetical protein EF813_09130 [Methanosarcinales archaeon]|nr:MAG: hypothetical protein EF813_09130 [Methanosarcinales archaeon]